MIGNLNYTEIRDNPTDCYITRTEEDGRYHVGIILPDGEICGAKMNMTYPQSCVHAAELKALTGLPYPTTID